MSNEVDAILSKNSAEEMATLIREAARPNEDRPERSLELLLSLEPLFKRLSKQNSDTRTLLTMTTFMIADEFLRLDSGTRLEPPDTAEHCISRMIHSQVNACASSDEVFTLLSKIIKRRVSITTTCYELEGFIHPERAYIDLGHNLRLSEEHKQSLKEACLLFIQEEVQAERLIKAPDLGKVLYRWVDWEEDGFSIINDWVTLMAANKKSVELILSALMSKVTTSYLGSEDIEVKFDIRGRIGCLTQLP